MTDRKVNLTNGDVFHELNEQVRSVEILLHRIFEEVEGR